MLERHDHIAFWEISPNDIQNHFRTSVLAAGRPEAAYAKPCTLDRRIMLVIVRERGQQCIGECRDHLSDIEVFEDRLDVPLP